MGFAGGAFRIHDRQTPWARLFFYAIIESLGFTPNRSVDLPLQAVRLLGFS